MINQNTGDLDVQNAKNKLTRHGTYGLMKMVTKSKFISAMFAEKAWI